MTQISIIAPNVIETRSVKTLPHKPGKILHIFQNNFFETTFQHLLLTAVAKTGVLSAFGSEVH